MNPLVAAHLRPVYDGLLATRRDRSMARYRLGAAGALLALLLIYLLTGWYSGMAVFVVLATAIFGSRILGRQIMGSDRDFEAAIQRVEEEQPDLRAALLTAAEQKAGPDGKLNHLQERVIREVADHALANRWDGGSEGDAGRARRNAGLATAALFASGLLALFGPQLAERLGWGAVEPLLAQAEEEEIAAEEEAEEEAATEDFGPLTMVVEPGDTEIERGSRLLVEAQFPDRLPKGATLVLETPDAEPRRFPMKPTLGDPVFAVIVSDIDTETDYRVEIDESEQVSDTFHVGVYEHPRLESADATVTPPEYTKREPKVTKDTRRVSAPEGSDIALDLALNKPVAEARLEPVEGGDSIPIEFAADASEATLHLAPEKSGKYRLHLTDADGRPNKKPPVFSITILENLPPSIELVFPAKDRRVTPLEEIDIKAKLWDDFGVREMGATVMLGDEERELVLERVEKEEKEGENPEGKDKKKKKRQAKIEVATRIALEDLNAQPDQVLSYHLWAEDVDAKGNVRRTFSDMFFADVRHFEETFEQAIGGSPPPPGEGGGDPMQKLPEIQREIMSAIWNLSRPGWTAGKDDKFKDIATVGASQRIAEGMVGEALAMVEDEGVKQALEKAMGFMDTAAGLLEQLAESGVEDTSPGLRTAMKPSRQAFEALLEAAGRHKRIQEQKQPPPSQGQGQPQPQEKELQQLELEKDEEEYEEEKLDAGEQQSEAEQKEDLLVLNRLRELARRQEAIAEKLRELQLALEEAESDEEKKEIEDQLARLKEQQEELLREMDELQEKMEQPENRARMAEESQKLEEARDEVQETGEKIEEGEVEQAANSAKRAGEELEEVRDDFQERTSGKFAQEMREMKQLARELSEEQKSLDEEIGEVAAEGRPTTAEEREANLKERKELGDRAELQQERLDRLVENMTETSEAAEESEPLLSEALYDGLRDSQMGQTEEALEAAGLLVERGYDDERAQLASEMASKGIEQIREAVEEAAESVLGDEEQALRFARKELDQAIEDLSKEIEAQTGKKPEESGGEQAAASDEAQPSEGQEPGESPKPGEGEQSEQASNSEEPGEGEKPGEGKEPGEQSGQGEGEGEGQDPQQASNSEQPGEGQKPGEGEQEGEQPGQGKGEGEESQQASNSEQPGEGKQPGKGEGQGEGEGQGQRQESESQQASNSQSPGGGRGQGSPQSPNDQPPNEEGTNTNGDSPGGGFFFDALPPVVQEDGVLAGDTEDYREWSDKLRHVQEILEDPELRTQAARAADRASDIRRDLNRNDTAPEWEVVLKDVFGPLVRLREDVDEELLRRSGEDNLAPIDRDPVPRQFERLVREYYEAVGGGGSKKEG